MSVVVKLVQYSKDFSFLFSSVVTGDDLDSSPMDILHRSGDSVCRRRMIFRQLQRCRGSGLSFFYFFNSLSSFSGSRYFEPHYAVPLYLVITTWSALPSRFHPWNNISLPSSDFRNYTGLLYLYRLHCSNVGMLTKEVH